MKANQGEVILTECAADHQRIRAVLCEWGYRESEIQRLLKQPRGDQKLETRCGTTDQNATLLCGVRSALSPQ